MASTMRHDAVAEGRRNGEWVLRAQLTDSGIAAAIEWEDHSSWEAPADRPQERSRSADNDEPIAELLRFPSLASYADFKAFWRIAGGRVEEQ